MNNDEFYIGWMPQASNAQAKYVFKVVVILAGLVISLALVLAILQRKFSTASFEFGQLTEVRGIYSDFPVPSIKVKARPDLLGQSAVLTIPLVGYGKFGAEGTLKRLEEQVHTRLDGKELVLKGTLLYSDGKTLLQVDENDHPLLSIDSTHPGSPTVVHQLGNVHLSGEILDPKCYFGVMKPGSGKPHRDCAIRCIEGGMSPVFYVRNEKGEANYYLLLDKEGKKMNEQLKNFIADPVTIDARAVQYDDWVVLYIANPQSIRRTGALSWFKTREPEIDCRPGN
jgi:hypothetical protein